MTKTSYFLLLIFAFIIILPSCVTTPDKETPPNIVLFFVDDMGYGDVGCYGASGYSTPNIDALAKQGMKFTDFYSVQAVCSASRAGLLTGCYPNRIGISGALMPWSKNGIDSSEVTMAEMLKTRGYTTAIYGKWHLGHLPQYLPLKHGFDEYLGLPYSNDMWPVDYNGLPFEDTTIWKAKYPPLPLIDGDSVSEYIRTLDDQAKLTTLYTERAKAFIDKHKSVPFFIYMPYTMVHVPIAVSDKFKGKSEQGLFGDVMMEVDWSVGEVMDALDNNGLTNNTLVIFTSDNGPWICYGNHAGNTGGFREAKGTTFEGGQREPCIIRWPGVVEEGSVNRKLAATIDIFPTLAEIVDAPLPQHAIDGISILPIIKDPGAEGPRESLLYYYHHNNLEAVRWKEWKLVLPHKYLSCEGEEPGHDGYPGAMHTQYAEKALYNLDSDPYEQTDLLGKYPEIESVLDSIIEAARNDLGDELTGREGEGRRMK